MEKLMHFVWEHRLGLRSDLRTTDGRLLRVIHQGLLNNDAGPDFFNATVTLGPDTWVGNIEIHVRASDWFRHGHQNDRAYDSVILHVVSIDDAEIRRPDGSVIPQFVMKCSPEAAHRCNILLAAASSPAPPCAATIARLPHIYHTDWLTALAIERLYRKSDNILQYVSLTRGHWEGAAYITLARALGFGLNSEPFEILAKNVPLSILNKHRDDLTVVEAIIFGQAGLIPPPADNEDTYITTLRREYNFFSRKFSLHPLPLAWKLSKTRPQNFPHRRLAILASFVHNGFNLMSRLADATSISRLRDIFNIRLAGFWAAHFSFATSNSAESPASSNLPALSRASIDTLCINAAIPLIHARAVNHADLQAMERAVDLLQQLPSENNTIVRSFTQAGLQSTDAFTSQALIQLRREYCEKRKCLYCRFGHRMLSAEIQS